MKQYTSSIGIYFFIYAISIAQTTHPMEDSFTGIVPATMSKELHPADQEYALLPHATQAHTGQDMSNPFEHATAQAHAGMLNIEVYTQEAGQLKTYTIAPTAARYAKNIKVTPGAQYTIQNMPDSFVCFIVELLNHLELLEQSDEPEEKNRHIAEFIIMRTERFTTISLSNIIRLILFFDIPITLNTLLSLRKPLPFPTTPAQEIEYNKQLLYIFRLRNLANGGFLELFGSMIYPRYITYPECLQMIQFYYFYKERLAPQTTTNPIFELAGDLEQDQTEHVI